MLDEFQEVARHRPAAAAADARGLPAAAGGRARLPRLQAPHDAADLQRRERAVLAQRQADRARRDRARRTFAPYIERQFERTGRFIAAEAVDAILDDHRRPPLRDPGALLLRLAGDGRRAARGGRATSTPRWRKVLRSEHAHFSLLWERASSVQRLLLAELAREPGRPLSADYRSRHNLPGAVDGAARGRGAGARRARRARPRAASGSSSRSSPRGCVRDMRVPDDAAASPGGTASARSASGAASIAEAVEVLGGEGYALLTTERAAAMAPGVVEARRGRAHARRRLRRRAGRRAARRGRARADRRARRRPRGRHRQGAGGGLAAARRWRWRSRPRCRAPR